MHKMFDLNINLQTITAELASKYNKIFEHFLRQRKTIAIVKYIFVNIEDNHFKIECSVIENTFVN